MKIKSLLVTAVSALVLMAFVGCASTKQTESLLAAAGFKIMPATTPEQQAHLKALPAGKVTTVVREGKTYFVYPDVKQQVLYVGQQPQYDQYQKLRLQNQMAEDQVEAAQMNSEAAFAPWGGWGGVGFVEPVPVYRR